MMTFDELGVRYATLRRQLSDAYAATHWSADLIDQLAAEIVAVERAMADAQRPPAEMVPAFGIEPKTFRLQGGCSTN
jgi:hypothetical protein